VRPTVLALSVLGFVLFAGAFAVSFVDSLLVERVAREVVRLEVERRVGHRIDDLSDSGIAALGRRALARAQVDVESTQKALREDIPGKVANVVADMLRADCECRKRLVEHARQSEADRLSSLTQVRERLVGLIEGTYASVTRSLMREFRVFTGSNAIAFALLGVVTLLRRNATLQLALPAVVLAGAVVVTGSLYLFNQNWLHTIVFGEYVGLAYAAYLAGVALLLADVVFNRARITTRMVNVVLQSVGSAVHALPC
jgi:hypothetical protein